MDVGLPPRLQAEIRDTFAVAVEQKGRWTRADGSRAYAGSCPAEYFAELTMWYFGTHGEFVDRTQKTPAPGPGGLAAHDPDGFALLASIYGGTHPALADADPPTQRLAPSPSASKSVDEEEEDRNLVSVEFDNRGCDCGWKLYWLTPEGTRMQYGEVQRDATYIQTTYAGHVWALEASSPTGAVRGGDDGGARGGRGGVTDDDAVGPEATPIGGAAPPSTTTTVASELRYTAAKGLPCVAAVSDDSHCRRPTMRH